MTDKISYNIAVMSNIYRKLELCSNTR